MDDLGVPLFQETYTNMDENGEIDSDDFMGASSVMIRLWILLSGFCGHLQRKTEKHFGDVTEPRLSASGGHQLTTPVEQCFESLYHSIMMVGFEWDSPLGSLQSPINILGIV